MKDKPLNELVMEDVLDLFFDSETVKEEMEIFRKKDVSADDRES